MRYGRFVIGVACARACLAFAAIPQEQGVDEVILALSQNATDPSNLPALKQALFSITDDEAKSLYGMVYCLGSLALGATQEGMTTRTQLLRAYADNAHVTSSLSDASISDTCQKCSGRGAVKVACGTCRGNGRCTTCGGTGKRAEVKQFSAPNCPNCGGSGNEREHDTYVSNGRLKRRWRETSTVCKRCGGSGKLGTSTATCLTCRGARQCRACGGKGQGDIPCSTCTSSGYIVSTRKCATAYQAMLARAIHKIESARHLAQAEQQDTAQLAAPTVAVTAPANPEPLQIADKPALAVTESTSSSEVAEQEQAQIASTKNAVRRASFLHSPIVWILALLGVGAWLIKKVV